MEVTTVAPGEPSAAIHPNEVLSGPVRVHDHAHSVPLSRRGVLDSHAMTWVNGDQVVGGSVVTSFHSLHVAYHMPLAVSQVIPPLTADGVVAP